MNKLLQLWYFLVLSMIAVFYTGAIFAQSTDCNKLIGSGEWSPENQHFSYYLPVDTDLLYPDSKWLPYPYNQACQPPKETMQQYCDRYFSNDKKQSHHTRDKECENCVYEDNKVVLDPNVTDYTSFSYEENNCTSPETALYGNMANTIKNYTQLSIERAGIKNFSVDRVDYEEEYKQFRVTLQVKKETSKADVKNFAETHQNFLCIAKQGLNGINACKATDKCWQPKYHPDKPLTSRNYPWAFFLPLGMAMTNQKTVNFLNYPPFDSLNSADYMKNFTMCRWNSVLKTAGIQDTFLYETIVDAHPIAAPGSGQSHAMPDATEYFNNTKGRYYDTPMIKLLAHSNSKLLPVLPVFVLGTDAREAWAKVIGVKDLNTDPDTGEKIFTEMPYVGIYKDMPWVASNHPDVTSYNCCAGDPDNKCTSDNTYGNSWSLLKDESIDLVSICTVKTLSDNPDLNPKSARSTCEKTWRWETADQATKYKICVQAKMDYNYTTKGKCETEQEAENFCSYYANNPCPTDIKPNPNLLQYPNEAKDATTKSAYYNCKVPTN